LVLRIAGYGSLAERQVAKRASLVCVGAQPAEETDEMEDARDEREALSMIIDSGDEDEEAVEGASDGRRPLNW
jgi:hypothetical protein